MPWGVDLWDRQDVLEHQTDQGIQFISSVRTFASKVAEIEKECAAKLSALAKANAPTSTGAPTFDKAWASMVASVEATAAARDASCTEILSEVCQPLKTLAKEKTQERQERLKEVAQLRAELHKHGLTFEKAKKAYEKVEKDANAAKASFDKVEANDTAAKKKVDQARREYASKAQGREDAERTLREDLDKFNRERTVIHYSQMPAVFDAIQALDENRAEGVVLHFAQFLKCMKTSASASVSAIESAENTCTAFNKGADSNAVSDKYKTGNPQPGDIPFETVLAPEAAAPKKQDKQKRTSTVPPAAAQEPVQPQDEPAPAEPAPVEETTIQIQMLYGFAGTNKGELPVAAGEMLVLIQDDGSGWAHVSRSADEQGYVPSSYYKRV